jgi:hypothetical protein
MNSYTENAKVNPESKPFQIQVEKGSYCKILYGFDTEAEAVTAVKTLERMTSGNTTSYCILENIMMTKQLGLW